VICQVDSKDLFSDDRLQEKLSGRGLDWHVSSIPRTTKKKKKKKKIWF
jgi:hypothetical protein